MVHKLSLFGLVILAVISNQAFTMNSHDKENADGNQRTTRKRPHDDSGLENHQAKKITLFRTDLVDVDEDWKQIERVVPCQENLVGALGRDRYSDIKPFGYNRFTFGESDKRYVNASRIRFEDCAQEFIQCQAPLPWGFGDHWQMVWESDAAITMFLAKFTEGCRVKADRYWPEGYDANSYESLEVELIGTVEATTSEGLELSEFEFVLRKDGKTKPHKILHFTSWPDGGVVSPKIMNELIDYARKENSDIKKPIIVHCSAGIGRAGAFVALYSLRDATEQGKVVNPKERVIALRNQRAFSVQTKEQYKLIINSLQN